MLEQLGVLLSQLSLPQQSREHSVFSKGMAVLGSAVHRKERL
jgi:hypothetical protein